MKCKICDHAFERSDQIALWAGNPICDRHVGSKSDSLAPADLSEILG